jgi:hypothetical protein
MELEIRNLHLLADWPSVHIVFARVVKFYFREFTIFVFVAVAWESEKRAREREREVLKSEIKKLVLLIEEINHGNTNNDSL